MAYRALDGKITRRLAMVGPGPGSGRADGSLPGSLPPPFGHRSLARCPVWPEGRQCRGVRRFDL